MDADHPMVWTRCIGKGRVFYSAFGHRAEAYAEPQNKALLTNAVGWALKLQGTECGAPAATPAGDKKP
jgi:type 1 glutamine amidotransferase